MKRPFHSLIAIFALLSLAAAAQAQVLPSATLPEEQFAGRWSGAATLPTGQPLAFSIELHHEEGAWRGTLDVPLQNAYGIPITHVSVEGDRLRFNIETLPGNPVWEAVLEDDVLKGTFRQGPGEMPFELKRGPLERPKRPQEPQPPLPYEAREVTFPSLAEGVTLAGTLTLPEGEGPFPAVVLISGSGPQNRDEELFDHRPFLVLADHLTRAGIAVLRYDDRGVAGSTGDFASATSLDFADDAEGAVRFLRRQPQIARDRIGLAGHSEGGLIAPIVAARSEEVAFIILMAGPGVSGREILVRQVREMSEAEGRAPESLEQIGQAMSDMVEALVDGDTATARGALERLLRAQMGSDDPAALPAEVLERTLSQFTTPWFRLFLVHDPAESLREVDVPVLVIQGELDRQVSAEVNVPAIREALSHNDQVRVEVLDGVNHMLQPASTGGASEYPAIETTVDERIPRIIAEWVKQLAGDK